MAVAAPTALRQVALAAGDMDATLSFWNDALGLPCHARFAPPGIAFIVIGGTRLFFADNNRPATVYLQVPDVERFCERLTGKGVDLAAPPSRVHVDAEGLFGPAGEAEWMAFVNDPAGNTVGLIERRAE